MDAGAQVPPMLGLIFEDREAAEKIFSRWRERFGSEDKQETIHLSVIRQVSVEEPANYKVLITSNRDAMDTKSGDLFTVVSRSITMTPPDSSNLDRFLTRFHQAQAYLLVPTVLSEDSRALVRTHYLLKCRVTVRNAKDVQPGDIEAMAFPPGESPAH